MAQTAPPQTAEAQKKITDADIAANALRNFITTGDQKSRQQFQKLWEQNFQNDAFMERLIGGIRSSPAVFKPLSEAYFKWTGEYPRPNELAEAVQICYEELSKPESERDGTRLAALGPDFIGEMGKIMKMSAVPVRASGRLDDATLDHFLELFSLTAVSGASKDAKAQELSSALSASFKLKDPADAPRLLQALTDAYLSIDAGNRDAFDAWLANLDEKQKPVLAAQVKSISMAKEMRLPYQAVRSAFESAQAEEEARKDRFSQERALLERYPSYVKQTPLAVMAPEFENSPNDYRLEVMGARIEYLRGKSALLQKEGKADDAKAVQKELDDFSAWLAKLGIETEKPEQGLVKLRAGIAALQGYYMTASDQNSELADYLSNISSNSALSSIYRRYLADLDNASAKLFIGVDIASDDYLSRIRERVRSKIITEDVKRAQEQWYNQYFLMRPAQATGVEQTPAEAQIYNRIANLDTLSASAFARYLENVNNGGVSSEEEKKLVLETVTKLYALNPMLVMKYFYAISNLADICQSNPDAFREALTVLSARVGAEVDPFISATAPTQMAPVNMRTIINRLDQALSEVTKIDKSALAQQDRLALMDDFIQIRPYPPHSIEQKNLGYAPRLLSGTEGILQQPYPYPFPSYLYLPMQRNLFTQGGVFTAPMSYGGTVAMPTFNPLQVYSSALSVGTAMQHYLDPQHPFLSLGAPLPGTQIAPLSTTRLLNELNRAFISTQRPEYSIDPLSGNAGLGASGRKTGADWQYSGAALGSLITPTGGIAAGAAVSDQSLFAGATAVAVPLGFVKSIPYVGTGKEEIGIDSLSGGYEKLDQKAQKIIARAIATAWDPKNPSQILLAVNQEQNVEGKGYMTARYYYVDKEGTIFEVKGGKNDFLDALNFIAGYGNQQFMTPTTYGWNYEPTIERGGGALAIDIGKFAGLLHAQAVPFFVEQGKPQPFLLQWTPAGAYTVENGKKVDVYQLGLPGSILRLKSGADGSKESQYIIQDIDYMMRKREDGSAWELRAGAGAGMAEEKWIGRGGFFLKVQEPTYRTGGGLSYEASAANTMAIALLNESEQNRRYIESLHRIGATIYGSKDTSNRLVLGALAHAVAQLREEKDAGVKYDTTFYRFVGLLKGLESGARVDLRRISGMDQMLMDYEKLGTAVGQDPMNASTYMNRFTQQYSTQLRQAFDYYSLGVQINKDLSLQAMLVAKEEEGQWTKQVADNLQGRMLYTFRLGSWTGFWRAFASAPVPLMFGVQGNQTVGVGGTGVGVDLFNGFWLQRVAVDAGVMIARKETGDKSWAEAGFFTQGALRVFSNVIEDSQKYKALVSRYESYRTAIREGKFSDIDENARKSMAEGLSPAFPQEMRDALSSGKDVKMDPAFVNDLEGALWDRWFYEQKFDIEKEFNGHMRAYLGASGYFFNDKTYWDVGMFMEYVDKFRMYIIGAKRDDMSIFAGADLTAGRWRAGLVGGVTEKGQYGAAVSGGMGFGGAELPMEVGVSGFSRSASIPSYTIPVYAPLEHTSYPEFGAIIYFRLGEGGGAPLPMAPGAPRTRF